MSRVERLDTASPQDLLQRILAALMLLHKKVTDGRRTDGELDAIEGMLETIPLTSEEFGLALNRLRNARRYLASAERGAARWELKMMRKQLQLYAETPTVDPTRRGLRGQAG